MITSVSLKFSTSSRTSSGMSTMSPCRSSITTPKYLGVSNGSLMHSTRGNSRFWTKGGSLGFTYFPSSWDWGYESLMVWSSWTRTLKLFFWDMAATVWVTTMFSKGFNVDPRVEEEHPWGLPKVDVFPALDSAWYLAPRLILEPNFLEIYFYYFSFPWKKCCFFLFLAFFRKMPILIIEFLVEKQLFIVKLRNMLPII
jgi:hypothetical protein